VKSVSFIELDGYLIPRDENYVKVKSAVFNADGTTNTFFAYMGKASSMPYIHVTGLDVYRVFFSELLNEYYYIFKAAA
jgi:hypothetical protein